MIETVIEIEIEAETGKAIEEKIEAKTCKATEIKEIKDEGAAEADMVVAEGVVTGEADVVIEARIANYTYQELDNFS